MVKYHINPKAVWSDGTPITYEDFVGMFTALNGKNAAFKPMSTSGYDQIQSAQRGASDQDVTVTFAKPYRRGNRCSLTSCRIGYCDADGVDEVMGKRCDRVRWPVHLRQDCWIRARRDRTVTGL